MIDERPCSRSRIVTGTSTSRRRCLMQHHLRLDLGVVVRVVGREQLDRLAVQRLEAARRVGDALAARAAETMRASMRMPTRRVADER